MWTVIRQFAVLFAIRGRLKIKVKFGQLFCEYCYSQFIRTINSFMWTFIRRSQKFINTMLSILVMEGIVFVYIFRVTSFAGHLNEYSQFACLQQLIRCFLFANVNESLLNVFIGNNVFVLKLCVLNFDYIWLAKPLKMWTQHVPRGG